ncbi:MAG: hypothetical protein ABW082_09705 [Sedimenticola sp.]
MNEDALKVDCAEWREVVEIFPSEMEVIMEMMIEADWEICN